MKNKKTISCLIIDDEPHCRSSLAKQLEWSCPDVTVLDTAINAEDGLQKIAKYNPDLIFLDIEMPDKNGFDLLKSLRDINFEVIFTTAYDSFALEAFKSKAIDYLVKPIDEDALIESIDRAKVFIKNRDIDHLSDFTPATNQDANKRLAFPISEGVKFVYLNDLIRCEAEGSYSRIYYGDNQQIFIAKTLKAIADLCQSSQLMRIHQSHLINIQHIDRYIKSEGGQIIMSDGSNIPIARRRKEEWSRWLKANH